MKLAAVIAILVLSVGSAAQSDNTSTASPSQSSSPSSSSDGGKKMFGLMPSFGVVEPGQQPPPLRPSQKFKLVLQNLDPYTFVFVGVDAAYNQALDQPTEYGQGAQGYGKRYGANLADAWTNSFFSLGVYPSLLKQDPRYYRQGTGSFFSRSEHAVSHVLVTRQDSGRRAFNFSEILGSVTAASVGVAYYPDSQRDAGDVFERAGIQIAFDAGFSALKEFYPDIARKLFGKKNNKTNNKP